MVQEIKSIADSVSVFIVNWLRERNSFECRSFYGETFALNLLYITNCLDEETKLKLIRAYDLKDKNDPEFHWEFNTYALLNYYKISNDNSVKKYIDQIKFKNTKCTNWTLLRSNARLLANLDIEIALKEAKEKINKYQKKSGLILDDKNVKSFQYHCFSLAMIWEIYEQTHNEYFKRSFLKGINFIRHFILSNGDTLYVGRGQEQSFGYSALIYILSIAYRILQQDDILYQISQVIRYVEAFRRKDGSIPLMLNHIESSIPETVDIQDINFCGWYPYNNYFDYLSFSGYFFAKTCSYLDEVNYYQRVNKYSSQEYRDSDFIKVVNNNYEAVLSRPGGYITNDLPIPYIIYNNKRITPLYGGEQSQKSLYTKKGIPLPFNLNSNKSIRWKSMSFFISDYLLLISPLGVMIRKYVFKTDKIIIKSRILSFFKLSHLYLFFKDSASLVENRCELSYVGKEYSACGELELYSNNRNKHTLVLRLSNEC